MCVTAVSDISPETYKDVLSARVDVVLLPYALLFHDYWGFLSVLSLQIGAFPVLGDTTSFLAAPINDYHWLNFFSVTPTD